jgi:predicted nucleic acid-binding protein
VRAIFDTNVFVAAGFNRASASARLLRAVEVGRLTLVWTAATRAETQSVLQRIPRLDWSAAAPLFEPEGEYRGETDLAAVDFVEDPQDRKFAALALASGATLVSADDHLLTHRDRLPVRTPGAFCRALEAERTG